MIFTVRKIVMQCHNPKECNRRLRKLIDKINCEIVKVDKFFECLNDSDNSLIRHNPSKAEKKQIINAIKANSSASCTLIEELKMHRTEVKYLMNAFGKLMQKHEKIKILQKKQTTEVEKLLCQMKTDILPLTDNNCKKVKSAVDWKKIQEQENCELEKTFEKLTSQFESVSKEYADLSKCIANCSENLADEIDRDKALFSLATRYIQKAFTICAELKSKDVKFLDYAFPNANADDDDSNISECCCCISD